MGNNFDKTEVLDAYLTEMKSEIPSDTRARLNKIQNSDY